MQIKAAEVLADIAPTNNPAIDTLRRLSADDDASVPFYKGETMTKNATVRHSAVQALGRFGPAARAAAPELTSFADLGGRAAEVLKLIEQRSKDFQGDPQSDPVVREAATSVLEPAAAPGSSAQACLDFMSDANPPKEVSKLRPQESPTIVATMRNLAYVGKAAAESLAKINARGT